MNFLDRLFGEHHEADRIYMDYAAATPLRHEVWEVMRPLYKEVYGNPSGVHKEAVKARQLIESAREKMALTMQVRADDIIFTSGGTEANNIAIGGIIEAAIAQGQHFADIEVITTALEHPSVSKVLAAYKAKGMRVLEVPVDESGRIMLPEFAKLLSEKTLMVVTALINSEIGVIQPTRKLKKLMNEKGKAVLIVDGAQAPLWHTCQLETLGADILTLDAGKCYGPKGVGALVYRHGITLAPYIFGGGQESGLRPGTENVAAIVGFEMAFSIAQANYERRSEGVTTLRGYFMSGLLNLDGVVINGGVEHRVANNTNISIPGIDTEYAVVVLDERGVAASTKSACSGAGGGQSAVVWAISGDAARASSTIRFTLGETSNKKEIDFVIKVLKEHIAKMRKI